MILLALIAASILPDSPPIRQAFLLDLGKVQTKVTQKPESLRILDVRKKAEYDAGHVPGAVWVDVKVAETLAARPGGLRDREAWEAFLAPIGWQPDGLIVVYGDNNQLDAARLWWLLTYLGARSVALMDGNYSLWVKEMRPVSKDAPKVDPKPFPVKFRGDRLATREDVASLLKAPGETRVIDARTEGEYTGAEKRSKKAGRIPSACHLEWATLVDQDGRFLKKDELRAKLERAGVKPDAPVVTHCQGGGRASVDAFVLESLDHPTKNYYLGWSDWGNVDDLPVEIGPANRRGK